ncbi:DinB family protein [Dactylosporangium aurantiacum]|uniref:DinB family protein n=1 Tax=Dactylosporangium aurantiacum TaxID=35754 RepID=A0A9Q9MH01_9ACTN|nr:DinB family protein [Dactylosporangium aurantiacum]MDG6108869.1 DinB family protein [Dactylosporangium aurantiacum]UWZ52166.1 DinB family protein [Dactylosporangium aurantiacum]
MPGNVPPVADERSGLLAFLDQQRQGVRNAAYGLTDEQARLAPTASSLTVGGLVKHLAQMERNWVSIMLREPGQAVDYEDGFRLREDETLAEVLADYAKAAEETAAAVAGIEDMGRPVPVPKGVPWFPDDVEHWSVRWVLLHLIEETARHAGHADIVREGVDGATCWPLMAAAEGWPATPWVQPWQPATAGERPA